MSDEKQSGLRELAEFVKKETLANATPVVMEISQRNDKGQAMLVPTAGGGVEVVDLGPFIPQRPARVFEHRRFFEIPSFWEYVNEHKIPASRIFATVTSQPITFTAIIDYHGTRSSYDDDCPDRPDWCGHKATLELRTSDQFNLWTKISGKQFSQEEFHEFLKDNRLDVVNPNAAELFDLVGCLEATSSTNCVGQVRTNEGRVLKYQDNVQTTVPVPDTLTISIPLFVGAEYTEIKADFKFRIERSGGITFGVRLLAIDRVMRDAVDGVRDRIRSAVELPIYV